MLVQDTMTGALHEVPEFAGYAEPPEYGYGYYGEEPDFAYYGDEAEPVGEIYDGFGNPVGLPFLAPIAGALAPLAAKVLPGIAAQALPAVSRMLPGIARAVPGVSQLVGGLLPRPPMPAPLPAMASMMPRLPLPFPQMGPPPIPPGWMRPPVPYQGLAPRRRYMRCVSWPGPPGLVPVSAAQAQPASAAIIAAAQGPIRRRRFRRRR
jgi:hypothetical protein